MRFVIMDIAEALAHGIRVIPTMRQSVDGTKVVLHEEMVRPFDDGSITKYEFDSEEFRELMDSLEWTQDEETPRPSIAYGRMLAVQQLRQEATAEINTLELTDGEALSVMELYPAWDGFIGSTLNEGMKVTYAGRLWRVRQAIGTVLENQPPSLDTAALYEVIEEQHAGTQEDPIPYQPPMEVFEGKYYTQDGVTYRCTRSSGQALTHNLSELVGLYVETV